MSDEPRGRLIGVVDEYGTIWSGEPGAENSSPIGDLVHRPDGETVWIYLSEPICESYCGFLDWTVREYGRVTHKQACPRRTDLWCQTHPQGCPEDCVPIGVVEAKEGE